MKLFNYSLLHKPTTLADANYYLLTEGDFPSVDLSHVLTLYNNQYREVQIKSDKPFDNIVKNQYFSFDVKDVVSFLFKIGTNSIIIKRRKKASDLLVEYWLYHTFLPILLTFENKYYFLHAGAVEIENKSVLFIADSFGGKSTLTDFFIKKGHTMISDDKVATFEKEEKIHAVPSYPYHRPYRKMEDLGIFVENFAKEIKPIHCIFNLIKSDEDSDINIEKISGIDKFKALRHATDIDLPVHKQSRFKSLANIANKVDIYNITIPWDLDRLEEVYAKICIFIKKESNEFKH